MKNEKKEQFNEELAQLSKSFTTLKLDYKKGVLKTAQGLLKIQRKHKELVVDRTGCSVSTMCKNG